MKPLLKSLIIAAASLGAVLLFTGCHHYGDHGHHRGHEYGEHRREAHHDRAEAEYDRREEWRDDRRREARRGYYH